MTRIRAYFEYHYLTVPPPFYLTSQMPKLFIPQTEKLRPRGKGLVQGHTVGPWQRQSCLFSLASLNLSPSPLQVNSTVFHKPAIPSSWWHFQKSRRHSAESLPSIKRTQDFDVLQLEHREDVWKIPSKCLDSESKITCT